MNHLDPAPEDTISAPLLVRRMGHDFNNLFSIILGGLTLLREEIPESAWDAGSVEVYDDVVSAATEAVDVMNQLTSWAGRQALTARPTDLNEIARELSELLARVLPDNISVNIDLAADVPLAQVDPARLQDALMELAANARDAMPGGGTITLATGGGESPRISVVDDGEGMTPEMVRECIQPYYSTRENGTRRGTGLSVVDGFARASDGRLEIQSKRPAGTRMTLHFPLT